MATGYQYIPHTNDCPQCGAPGAMLDNLHWDGCNLARQTLRLTAKAQAKERRGYRLIRRLKSTL